VEHGWPGIGSAPGWRMPEHGDAYQDESHPDHVSDMNAVASRQGQEDDIPPIRVEPYEYRPEDDCGRSHSSAHGGGA
jgi:hypothetical protein